MTAQVRVLNIRVRAGKTTRGDRDGDREGKPTDAAWQTDATAAEQKAVPAPMRGRCSGRTRNNRFNVHRVIDAAEA